MLLYHMDECREIEEYILKYGMIYKQALHVSHRVIKKQTKDIQIKVFHHIYCRIGI